MKVEITHVHGVALDGVDLFLRYLLLVTWYRAAMVNLSSIFLFVGGAEGGKTLVVEQQLALLRLD